MAPVVPPRKPSTSIFVETAKLDPSQVVDERRVNHPAHKPFTVQLHHTPPNPHNVHK